MRPGLPTTRWGAGRAHAVAPSPRNPQCRLRTRFVVRTSRGAAPLACLRAPELPAGTLGSASKRQRRARVGSGPVESLVDRERLDHAEREVRRVAALAVTDEAHEDPVSTAAEVDL